MFARSRWPSFSRQATVLVSLTLVLGCSPSPSPSTSTPAQRLITPGTKAPALQAEGWLYGQPPRWPNEETQWTVLVCWSYWCGPCHQRAKTWVELAKRYESQNVRFCGLTAEGAAALDETRREATLLNMTWPLGYGAGETLQALGVSSIPVEILVGPDGTVEWTNDSASSHDRQPADLEQAIEFATAPPSS